MRAFRSSQTASWSVGSVGTSSAAWCQPAPSTWMRWRMCSASRRAIEGSAASTLTSAASDAFSSPRSASRRDGVATNSAWISGSVRPVTSVRNESGRTQPPPAPRSA